MAVTRRSGSSGSPSVSASADPVYSRIPDWRITASATGTASESAPASATTGVLTGWTANVRSGAEGFTSDSPTVQKTAAAISRSQGLGDEGTSAILDYWDASGRWPDFTGGAGNSAGAVTAPPGARSGSAQSPASWIWIAAIAGGVALLLLLTGKRKGR